MREHKIVINQDQCIGCGLCKRDCPASNITVVNQKAAVQTQDCIMCGHCVAICPKAAVSITGFKEQPVEYEKQMLLDPHQLMEAIRSRRSIRHFKQKPIPAEVITQIIEAGRFTPTAKNAQDISYIVLQKNIGRYEKLAVEYARKLLPIVKLLIRAAKKEGIDQHFFFKKAPAAIVIVSKDKVSASLAAENMALMAEAHGLGVLYSGFFTIAANGSGKLRSALNLKKKQVVTTLVLGYPDVKYRRCAQRESAVITYL